jgi:hypothetical protein
LASDSSKLFLPGEKVKLKIQKISNENFELLIHSSHERVSVKFTYPQFAALDTSGFYVKRINAIDQFRLVDGLRKGNEGLEVEVIPTKARALGSKWENVSILKRGGQVLPFTAPSCIHVRGVDTALDYDKIFHYSEINKSSGAQVVDIF